jgi:cytochrome P450
MRLYPPGVIFARKSIGDDVLGGYAIPANSMIITSPYAVQHNAAIWPDPEVFDPDRFTPERSADRPHYAYFPFGGRPRPSTVKVLFVQLPGKRTAISILNSRRANH